MAKAMRITAPAHTQAAWTDLRCMFMCVSSCMCQCDTERVCAGNQLKRNRSHLLWSYILLTQVRQQTALGHLNPAVALSNTHMSC